MKATKKSIPALLSDSTQPSQWRVNISTRYDSVDMLFTNKTMADAEYKRIKSQGTYGGQWLTSIELTELKGAENDTAN